jgi:hypothetical protein
MAARRTFGKLGNRQRPRISVGIGADMMLPHASRHCRIEDASPGGVRLTLDNPPKPGTPVMLRFADIEALGTVVWAEEACCALQFDRELTQDDMYILQWMAQDPERFEQADLDKDTAVWR